MSTVEFDRTPFCMPYLPQSPDTTEAADRAQFEILRRLGAAQRRKIATRMIDDGYAAQWRAMQRAHPELAREQLLVEWVRVHYSEDLAERYANYWRCKTNK